MNRSRGQIRALKVLKRKKRGMQAACLARLLQFRAADRLAHYLPTAKDADPMTSVATDKD